MVLHYLLINLIIGFDAIALSFPIIQMLSQ